MDEIEDTSIVKDRRIQLESILNLSPLLVKVEKQVISILIVKGLVKVNSIVSGNVDDFTFDNVSLTNKGLEVMEEDPMFEDTIRAIVKQVKEIKIVNVGSLTDEQVDGYRNVFPQGSRGPGDKIVRYRLEKFMKEYNCTYDEIVSAAKLYIRNNSSKGYNIQGAHYFLFKQDQQSKLNESKCEEFLEEVRRLNIDNSPDWRDKVV